MVTSIILENLNREDLKAIISEAIKESLPAAPEPDKYLSRQQVRQRLGISLPTLDKQIATGRIRAQRIGGRILITETDLKKALKEIPVNKYR